MTKSAKFIKFLNTLQTPENVKLLESVKQGFRAVVESYEDVDEDVDEDPIGWDDLSEEEQSLRIAQREEAFNQVPADEQRAFNQFYSAAFNNLHGKKDFSKAHMKEYLIDLSRILGDILSAQLTPIEKYYERTKYSNNPNNKNQITHTDIECPDLGDGPLTSVDIKAETTEELIQKIKKHIADLENPIKYWYGDENPD